MLGSKTSLASLQPSAVGHEAAPHAIEATSGFPERVRQPGSSPSVASTMCSDSAAELIPVVHDVTVFFVFLGLDIGGVVRHGDDVALIVAGRWGPSGTETAKGYPAWMNDRASISALANDQRVFPLDEGGVRRSRRR